MLKISFACVAALFGTTLAAPEADKVETLPTFPEAFPSATYSGYLRLADGHTTSNKALHYVFVESENDPTTDPVMVWFNGGPGCSSMLAFLQEHGPIIQDETTNEFVRNANPWTARASLIYLESPAGVGFSTANPNERTYNDFIQADDAFNAIQKWYEAFPEFGPGQQNNKLFIAGESYGGVYAPYLTWKIYEHNVKAKSLSQPEYNLQGVIVGNGATDWDYDVWPAFPDVVYNFQLLSKQTLQNYTDNNCEFYFNDAKPAKTNSTICDELFDVVQNASAGLNWYDLYRYADSNPLGKQNIMTSHSPDRWGTVMIDGVEKKYKKGFTFSEYTPWLKGHPANVLAQRGAAELVMAANLTVFLNQADVKAALHVDEVTEPWEMCGGVEWEYQLEASKWIYRILKHTDLRMLFFSGDTDGAVTTLGTRRWMRSLEWDVEDKWRPWFVNNQVAGYVEKYDGGLTFATVKGVGHMAPQWAGPQCQLLVNDWMAGVDLPKY